VILIGCSGGFIMKNSTLLFLVRAALLLVAFSGVTGFIFLALCLFPRILPIAALLLLVVAIALVLSGLYVKHLRLPTWKIARVFFGVSFAFWFFVLLAGAVCCHLSLFGIRMVSSRIRLPSADVCTIAIDSKNRIYCAEELYGRLQVFDGDGSFLRGWFIRTKERGSSFGFYIDENDHPCVRRDDTLYVYDSNGLLLSVDDDLPDPNRRYAGYQQYTVENAAGDKYESVGGLFSPWKLVKIQNDRQTVLISEPFTLWFISPIFPGAFFIVISVLSGLILDRKIKGYEILQAHSSSKVTM